MKNSTPVAATLMLLALANPAFAAGDPNTGKEKAQTCQACHGANGNSNDPQYPRLAGQHANYIVRALKDYKSGARKNPIMGGFAAALTETEMEDLAAWYNSQSGLNTPEPD